MSKLEQIRALKERRATKGSRGSVEGHARTGDVPASGPSGSVTPAAPPELRQGPRARKKGTGIKPGPRETKPKKPKAAKKRAKRAKKPAPVSKVKVGRPRAEDRGKTLSDTKPWVAAKMSRASWYRKNKPK